MNEIIQDLTQRFSGTDVFVVGGGNSLHNFNFASLQGKSVIAVNSAYKFLHVDIAIYWADASWAEGEGDALVEHPTPYKFTSKFNINKSKPEFRKGFAGAYILNQSGGCGYDPNPEHVKGNNSGVHAINLAINLQAKRVVLLGFDMGHVMNQSHFHKLHKSSTPLMTYNDMFIPSLNALAKEVAHTSVEIVNCSNQSRLTCFKKGNIEDYL